MNHSITAGLIALADTGEYREFNRRIVNTPREVLGVRMPDLRRLAREVAAERWVDDYLDRGPSHSEEPTHEHVLLYGLVLAARSRKMTLPRLFELTDRLIPFFDSWAHVDVIVSSLKIFSKYPHEVYDHFLPLRDDRGEFTKRTFAVLLMDYFMDDAYIERTLHDLSKMPQGQYYVDMAIAWAISVALVKHYHTTLPWLEQPHFSRWVHNKAIQKARESFRLDALQKRYLDGLKIK